MVKAKIVEQKHDQRIWPMAWLCYPIDVPVWKHTTLRYTALNSYVKWIKGKSRGSWTSAPLRLDISHAASALQSPQWCDALKLFSNSHTLWKEIGKSRKGLEGFRYPSTINALTNSIFTQTRWHPSEPFICILYKDQVWFVLPHWLELFSKSKKLSLFTCRPGGGMTLTVVGTSSPMSWR